MFQQRHSIIVRRLNKQEFVNVYGEGTTKTWKKIKNLYDKCYLCQKKEVFFDVEHVIPVCFAGDELGLTNLNLICHKCHARKSGYDRELIYICKRLGLVTGTHIWTWIITDVHLIHELYLFLFNVAQMRDKINDLEYAEYAHREQKRNWMEDK